MLICDEASEATDRFRKEQFRAGWANPPICQHRGSTSCSQVSCPGI